MTILFLPYNRQEWSVEETASTKTSPQRKIPNQRRTCWSIAPMALMRLIRYISDVKSFHSMILMGDLLVVEIKAHEKFYIIETFHTFADILNIHMPEQKFRIILTGEAQDFLESLSLAARKK